MIPWMWISYAPTYRFPWGGDWAQQVDTNTVVDALAREGSSDPQLEREAIGIASYGRQLGWITEVLLAQDTSADRATQVQGDQSLDNLRETRARIQALKHDDPTALAAAAATALAKLQQVDPSAHAKLLARVSRPKKV
ncbi:MAG: hypothetical protein EOP81_16550 [Variovorax sp.]|nr:MAG: hypothetical protein EOP81_16550 [Variovorax sp.]